MQITVYDKLIFKIKQMKLLSLTITKVDSTSFYRANGVFGDLKRKMNIQITSMDVKQLRDMNWSDLMLFDAVFMQRPYSAVNLQMAQYLKDINIPLWIDYDDNLFEIPRGNRARDTFMNEKTHKQIAEICQLANIISVSTPKLGQYLSKFNTNIRVIPNALNTEIFNKKPQKTNKTALWRGSDTHQIDIYPLQFEISDLQETFKDWDFLWFGWDPYYITPASNMKYLKPTDPILYVRQLERIAPKIMHVPLIDIHFNRCKSNIAYLEGTYAGAACLVPDWPEWNMPGTVKYSNPDEYIDKLKLMLTGNINFNRMNREAWEYITENLTLEKVNKQRVQLLEELCSVNV